MKVKEEGGSSRKKKERERWLRERGRMKKEVEVGIIKKKKIKSQSKI